MSNGNHNERRRATREVILDAAFVLFSREDMRGVAVDDIVAASGVSKATVYRHFRSKDDLVVAFLRRCEDLVREGLASRLDPQLTPRERIIGVFQAVEEWCAQPDFRGSAFTGAAFEFSDTGHPAWGVVRDHIEFITGCLRTQAEEAGVREPEALARQLVILIAGALDVVLLGQDASMARFATRAAERLLADAA